MIRRPPRSTLFPYTTLFRSETAPGHRSFHNEEWPRDINAWVHIGEDGGVTGFTGKAEIGQNARTELAQTIADRKSTRLNSSHDQISYAVFCLKKKKRPSTRPRPTPPRTRTPTCPTRQAPIPPPRLAPR